ncbi:MAG: hypothetical protein QM687_00335 [Ferruginibacter sp.]
MEENAASNLKIYITCIPTAEEASITVIRHWKNLAVAFDGDMVWIKGFTQEQAFSSYLRQIPFIELYEQREGLLFKKNRFVPEKKLPGGLLWNPLQRAYPVTMGDVNHNYFGIQQNIPVRIVASDTEQPAAALLTDIEVAKSYINRSAAIRLQPLNWSIIGKQAFFTGIPLLSIPGIAYWAQAGNFLPAGYDFEFPMLGKNICQQLDPKKENKIIWFADSSYVLLPVKCLVPLSISSFRLSTQ